jgi:hypothetical protein
MEMPSPTIFCANTGSGTRSMGTRGPDRGALKRIFPVSNGAEVSFDTMSFDAVSFIVWPRLIAGTHIPGKTRQ